MKTYKSFYKNYEQIDGLRLFTFKTDGSVHLYISTRIFFPIFSKNVAYFEKIVKLKNIQNLFSHKKGYIHFRRRTSPALQKRLGPQKLGWLFSQKIQPFLKKLLNNNGIRYLICDKKSYVNFWRKMPTFPKKLSNVPLKQFFTENTAFFEKNNCLIKKYSDYLICDIKVIFIFGVRWLLRSLTVI